ncbi:MAG: SIMPL domain-containing protein [Chloroflexi bacterium]|nr:SIMPL domain-containing protein [Chloroflexota bacterium]
MRKLVLLAIVGLLFLAGCTLREQGAVPQGASAVLQATEQTGLVVSGEGLGTYVPDIAVLRLGIASQETTVAQAQLRAREAMAKVVAALKGKGVADKDIQTQYFSIQPVTQYIEETVGGIRRGRQITVGYLVSNTVQAKLRKVDEAGPIIDAVAEAGGDLTRIDSIGFTKEDITQEKNLAREKAVKDAQAKAQQIAGLLGIELGKPLYITESSPYMPVPGPIYARAEAAGAPSTPILVGEQQLTVTVQIIYSIK